MIVGPILAQDGDARVAVSPDGHQIISAGGRTIRRWDAESGSPIGGATHCISGGALCIAYSPDGTRMAFGETDGPLRVWDTAMSPGTLHAVTHEEYTVWSPCVAFSPDGAFFAFAAPDGAVRICDSASSAVAVSLSDDGAQVHAVGFSPDGAHIVLGSQDHALRIYNIATQQLEHILRGHSDMVLSVAYSPSGKQIASGSSNGTVRIWDAEIGRPIGAPLDGHQELITRSAFGEREVIRSQESIHSVSWSPDGRSLASSPHGFNLQEIRVWDLFD